MKIDSFLKHHELMHNPFEAEEARHDPVFDRLVDAATSHPDFAKIVGRLDKPATAVVFGEKGSGKTAMRLMIGRYIDRHNRENPDQRVLLVPYDDFNPVLDNMARTTRSDGKAVLEHCRLEDHQDAILSQAVSELTTRLLAPDADTKSPEPVRLPDDLDSALRAMPRQARVDLMVLAALYDQPQTGTAEARWRKLRSKLRLAWRVPLSAARHVATALTVVAAGLAVAVWWMANEPVWLPTATGVAIAGAVLLWGYWLWRQGKAWWLARRVARDLAAVDRAPGELRRMLTEMAPADLARQPMPAGHGDDRSPSDARYQLTRRLLAVLRHLGHVGMIVLIDRVDEPTLIAGDAERMKALIWPAMDNKFLQQDGVGIKLLLPIELRHLLMRETGQFFQEARLDKQNLIDRLTWSGTTLYDLCSARLNTCRPESASDMALTDLFEEGVTRETLIDALDQMHQPRDAFKFLYSLVQEHCRLVPEDEPNYRIAKLTLETVRKAQSQRVQELYRGLTPA